MTGMAVGAAGSGFRPVVNWRATTFTLVAFDQIVNHVAKLRYMTGGQADFPILFRTYYMGGMRSAAQHTQSAYAMLAHVPGLKLVAPATPADAMGLIRSAIQDNNPVISFEAMRLPRRWRQANERGLAAGRRSSKPRPTVGPNMWFEASPMWTIGQNTRKTEWLERDPIEHCIARLKLDGELTDATLSDIRTDVDNKLATAVKFAEASPFPTLESAFEDVFAD